jgi:hypothetical protein
VWQGSAGQHTRREVDLLPRAATPRLLRSRDGSRPECARCGRAATARRRSIERSLAADEHDLALCGVVRRPRHPVYDG